MSSKNNNRQTASWNKGDTAQAGRDVNQRVYNFSFPLKETLDTLSKFFMPAVFIWVIKDGRIQIVIPPPGQPLVPPADPINTGNLSPVNPPVKPTPPEKSSGVEFAGLSQSPNIPPNPIIQPPSNSAVSVTNGSGNQVETNNASKNITITGNNGNVVVGKTNEVSQNSKNAETTDQADKSPATNTKKPQGKEVASKNTTVPPTVNVVFNNVPKQSAPEPTRTLAYDLPYDPPRRSKQPPEVGVSPKAGSPGKTHQPNKTPKPSGEQAPAPKEFDTQKQAPAKPIDEPSSPWFPKEPPKQVIPPTDLAGSGFKPVPKPSWETLPNPNAPASPHTPTGEVPLGTSNATYAPSPNPGGTEHQGKHGKGDIAIGLNDGQKPKAAKTEQPTNQQPDIDEPKVGMSKYEQYMERRDPVVENRQAKDARSNVTPKLEKERPPVPRSSSTHEVLPSAQAPVPAKYEPVQTAQPMTQNDPDVDPGMIMTSKPGTNTNNDAT